MCTTTDVTDVRIQAGESQSLGRLYDVPNLFRLRCTSAVVLLRLGFSRCNQLISQRELRQSD